MLYHIVNKFQCNNPSCTLECKGFFARMQRNEAPLCPLLKSDKAVMYFICSVSKKELSFLVSLKDQKTKSIAAVRYIPVSYTHLDVYKRQQ